MFLSRANLELRDLLDLRGLLALLVDRDSMDPVAHR